MITDIGTGARAARSEAAEAGIDTVLLPWPRMGSENVIHSGSNGLFIPKNCKTGSSHPAFKGLYRGRGAEHTSKAWLYPGQSEGCGGGPIYGVRPRADQLCAHRGENILGFIGIHQL